MILTAKHHDGFCLWPTKTTAHSVASSPWRGGEGDVVREFVDACRAEGLKAGLYCSPWDRNASSYGDSPRYNDLYVEQLTELLTRYGTIHEVWFDGANGEGPNGPPPGRTIGRVSGSVVRRLQPEAVMFSDAGPDVRWIGNETGSAGDPNWSTVDPSVVPYPGATGEGVTDELQHGDPEGSVWRPGETDVSIRPGWFYHPEEDEQVRSVDGLVDLYFTSVGRNSKLLLNVPPMPEGVLHETDASAWAECTRRSRRSSRRTSRPGAGEHERPPGRGPPCRSSTWAGAWRWVWSTCARTSAHEQSVAGYRVEGLGGRVWRTLSRGLTIGYRKLDRWEPVAASAGCT